MLKGVNEMNIQKYARRIEQELRALKKAVKESSRNEALEALGFLQTNVSFISKELE
jgi:hypothetical protein